MRRTVFGRNKVGVAYWAANTALGMRHANFGISTREGNIIVNFGNGVTNSYITAKNEDATTYPFGGLLNLTQIGILYGSPFIGNIILSLLKGLKDVFSINIGGDPFFLNQSWESFIAQFSFLYSVNMDQPHSGFSYVYGDIAIMPDSVERFRILDFRTTGNLVLNFSNFSSSSKLRFLQIGGGQYSAISYGITTGDLAKIPSNITVFNISYAKVGSRISYTAGRVWANNFSVLNLSIQLRIKEANNLFKDLKNSITMPPSGVKSITLNNSNRDGTSDADVAFLQSIGYTITCNRISFIYSNKVRFIRDWLNGSNVDGKNQWVELQVIDNNYVNVALGKIAIIKYSDGTTYGSTYVITDGVTNSDFFYQTNPMNVYAFIDLGSEIDARQIITQHYSGRNYNTKLEFSADGITWFTLYDSSISGTYSEGSGKIYYL